MNSQLLSAEFDKEPMILESSTGSKDDKWEKHQGLPLFNPLLHSDGCSGGLSVFYQKMKFLHKKHGSQLKWRDCCEIHDQAYYYGGSKQQKIFEDASLNTCVSQVTGYKFLGKMLEIAVKIGGGPHLPTSFRWGYGEDFRVKSNLSLKPL